MRTIVSLNNLKDYQVLDGTGETLGTIEDVVIDPDMVYARYFVLATRGRLLGPGSERFAVPVSAVQLDTENEAVVIDVDGAALENAPRLDAQPPSESASPRALYRLST